MVLQLNYNLLKKIRLSFACLLFLFANANAQTLQLTPSSFNGYNISCFGFQDGSIDLTITGGTPPYTIEWSNAATSEDIADLAAGLYIVEVDDANPATEPVQAEITLTEPEAIQINELEPYRYPNGFNVSQHGACNGTVTGNITGGVPPYSYQWEKQLQQKSIEEIMLHLIALENENKQLKEEIADIKKSVKSKSK